MQDKKLEIIVEGIDRATMVFNDIAKQLKALKKEADRAGGGMGDSFSRSRPHLAGVETQLGGIAKQILAIAGAWKLLDAAKDSLMLSSRVKTLSTVLETMGKNVVLTRAEMNAYVDQVKAMGITTETSQQTIIRMTHAQLDLTKSAELARVAQDAAVIGDVNSSEALERMIHGITTLQPEILRTIGITVNFEQEYRKAAVTLGKNVDQLTQAEKQQIAMNAVIEKATQIKGVYAAALGTANKQLGSLKRVTEEVSLKLGELADGAFAAVIFEIAAGFEEWDKTLSAMKESGAIAEISDDLQYGVLVALNDIKTLALDLWNIIKELGPAFKIFLQLIVMAVDGWGDIFAAMQPVTEIMGKLIGMGRDFLQVLKEAANILTSIATGDVQGLKQALKGIGRAATDLATKTSEASAMAYLFPESVANSLLARDAAKQAARQAVEKERAEKTKKERENAEHLARYGLRRPTYAPGEADPKTGSGKGAENALAAWAAKLRDLGTDIQKALFPDDEIARKMADIKNKYDDLIVHARKHAFDTSPIEEWRKVMEKAARDADAEKKLKVWADVEEQITERTASEIEKRLAEEDRFLRDSEDKLRKAGFAQEEISGKMVKVTAAAAERKKKIELDYINTIMEAESRRYLSELDMMEKERVGTKTNLTRQRISVYESLLESYQRNWENETDPMAKISWADKIDETRSKLVDLNVTLRDQQTLLTEGLGQGLADYLWEMKSTFQQGVDIARETAQAMETAFSDFFFDAFQGKLKSLGDYITAFATAVQRTIANALGQQVTSGIGGLLKTALSSLSTPVANYVPGVHHDGGTVRRYIPVFHGGGLNTDERVVINRIGERYITEEQNEWLTRIAKKAEGQQKVTVIVNNNGQPIGARQQNVQVNPQETIVTLWLDALDRNAYGLKNALGG